MSEDSEVSNCNFNYFILDVVASCIAFLVFCIVCVVGWIAIRKIHSLRKIRRSLKYTLYAAILCAFINVCSMIVTNVFLMCEVGLNGTFARGSGISGACSFMALVLCLLINLFLRLDITFGESALAMSTRNRRTFVSLICLEILLIIATIVLLFATMLTKSIILDSIFAAPYILFLLIYLLLSFALVREFINNLMDMAKFCVGPSQNASNLKLNNAQKQKVNLSAKYLALYCVAAGTSVFTLILYVLYMSGLIGHQIGLILGCIDLPVNICCLVLQYAVMSDVYTKYCHCIDGCCRDFASNLMKRRVRQILTERAANKSTEGSHVEESDVLLINASEPNTTAGNTCSKK